MLARSKRVLNDYTLANDLDRQFGDLPVGLRKMRQTQTRPALCLAGSPALPHPEMRAQLPRTVAHGAYILLPCSSLISPLCTRSLFGRMSVRRVTATQAAAQPWVRAGVAPGSDLSRLIDDSSECNFLDNRWLWPRKAGAAINEYMDFGARAETLALPLRADSFTLSHFDNGAETLSRSMCAEGVL